MQVLDDEYKLCCQELSAWSVKNPLGLLSQKSGKTSTQAIIHEHVDHSLILGNSIHFHHKWMID